MPAYRLPPPGPFRQADRRSRTDGRGLSFVHHKRHDRGRPPDHRRRRGTFPAPRVKMQQGHDNQRVCASREAVGEVAFTRRPVGSVSLHGTNSRETQDASQVAGSRSDRGVCAEQLATAEAIDTTLAGHLDAATPQPATAQAHNTPGITLVALGLRGSHRVASEGYNDQPPTGTDPHRATHRPTDQPSISGSKPTPPEASPPARTAPPGSTPS